jgi:hypothetical protein
MVERSSRLASRRRGHIADQQIGMIRAARHSYPGLVEVELVAGFRRTVARRIGNPSVDLGFAPAGSMDAYRYLRRERPFCDLAIDRRTRQSCAMKDGFEPDDTIWFWHIRNSIAWWSMTSPALKLIAFSCEKRAARVHRKAARKKRRTAAANCMASLDAEQTDG